MTRAYLMILAMLVALPAASATTPPVVSPNGAPGRVAVLTADQVIQILDDTVDWYRTLGTQQQSATQPSDLLILYANRQTAGQVVSLAFDIARANAELLSSEANASDGKTASPSELLVQQQLQLAEQRAAAVEEMKRDSASKQSALQGELAMLDARKNLLDTMSGFVNESNPKGAGANALKAHIDAIAAAIPSLSIPQTPAVAVASVKPVPARTGIWDLSVEVLAAHRKVQTIAAIDARSASLAQTFLEISAQPVQQLESYAAKSDALAAKAHGADQQAQAPLRAQFDTLAWLFQQTSAIVLPLDKEKVLLQQYRHNLGNWRNVAESQFQDTLQALGLRVAILVGMLLVVYVLAEVWRRAVVRFVQEPRRRYQLLLIRRIAFWAATLVIVGISFATEISSFATFAGLLTAGVAVAMQSVLVSVVGYFFLIGKYGIRIGDRIQIGTVIGEVIDIGLVRMHLMELNSNGPLGPTGRVVAFANLVVFQSAGGLFKQIPGVDLAWHETTVKLPVVDDYLGLKNRLLAAVRDAVSGYRVEIVRQTKEIERSTASTVLDEAVAQVQLHLLDSQMVAVVRYPVNSEHAIEIDERVAAAILKIINVSR